MGIVLSGSDGDGAIGIKRIKERGGLTIAQEPEEAEHVGMPREAIATGMVDWVLPVADIPARLIQYRINETRLRLPSEHGQIRRHEPAAGDPPTTEEADEAALREVLSFLRMRTGRDFLCYKRATILRRIARRMQVNGLESIPSYLGYMRTHPGEAGALLQNLLISVTNFFRDSDAFAALESEIPRLFKGKRSGDQIRVWVAGCATGEEAYSIAILLCEYVSGLEIHPTLQIFATDLDENAIHLAREGIYPETIAADVSEERLRRFFTKDQGQYRVKREVREIVLFAQHDLLKDSPFSRLDLVSCRNLLIYLNRDAESHALETFHFALRPEGLLFLGLSESADDASTLFSHDDKKHHIYERKIAYRTALPVPTGPTSLSLTIESSKALREIAVGGLGYFRNQPAQERTRPAPSGAPMGSLGELHYTLLESISPPSIVVDAHHNIVHLSEHAGRFLRFAGGESTLDLLRVVHPLLRVDLRAALLQAASGHPVDGPFLSVNLDGETKSFRLRVKPSRVANPDFFLVVFEEGEVGAQNPVRTQPAEDKSVARHLEDEIDRLKAQLRDTIEQHEASSEEMKASNEELQAMNEELRSATEELETSREELQSINEELTTVNQELKSKVDELGRSNSDLQNLMASTNIATVFLDRALRIKRYTPSAIALFSLIPSDVGRPLSDLRHQLNYDDLPEDAERVLEYLTLIEREVPTRDDRWFLARLLPYRTTEDQIAGVVLTFVDITERKFAVEALRASEARFRSLVNQSTVGIMQTGPNGRITYVNERFCELAGHSEEELLAGLSLENLLLPEDFETIRSDLASVLNLGRTFVAEVRLARANRAPCWTILNITPVTGRDNGQVIGASAAWVDITDRKAAEEQLLRMTAALDSDLTVMKRLHELGTELTVPADLEVLMGKVLDATMEVQEADFGNIQLLDPETGRLIIAVQRGFSQEFVDHFDDLQDMSVCCGQAAVSKQRHFVEDVEADPDFAPHLEVIRAAGYRSVQSTPLIDQNGRLLAVLSTHFRRVHKPTQEQFRVTDLYARQGADIISFRRGEEKLRLSEQRLRSATLIETVGIIFFNDSGVITEANDAFLTMSRYTPEDLENGALTFKGLVTPEFEDIAEAAMQEYHRSGRIPPFQKQNQRKDRTRAWTLAAGRRISEHEGVAYFIDITETKEAELKLAQLSKELEAAGHAKDQFLAMLSHELRTPLTPVTMALHLLRQNPDIPGSAQPALEMIDRNVRLESRLIDDLLDITRISRGLMQIVKAPIDLHQVIHEAEKNCRNDFESKGILCTLRLEATSFVFSGDAIRLQQVIWNLLKNCAKFTPEQGRVSVATWNEGSDFVVEVADSGLGIAADKLELIFEAFIQAGEGVQRKGGLGLGLAISKAIVDAHGGTLAAQSPGLNQGTVVVVRLPMDSRT